jgi:uracil-DNA glycosylase
MDSPERSRINPHCTLHDARPARTIRRMSKLKDERSLLEQLTGAARQLLAIEQLLGSPFVPARPEGLPTFKPAAPQAIGAPGVVIGDGPAIGASMTPAEKEAALAELNETHVRNCTRCVLAKTRTQTVFGEGSASAELVFVGEGPGADEDASGRPFVGRAGELLTKMIIAMGLSREQVFIANVVKCRPPNNRTPAPEEVTTCWPYLVQQLQIICPKVIVTLGNPSTQTLLQTKTGITRLRGEFQPLPAIGEGLAGISVMPTFHPAYLLRNYSPEARGKVWSDLQQVMQLLGLSMPK